MNKIIAIVGLCGTGKSEAMTLVEKHGYHRVYFGGVVVEEVKARGLEVNENNERIVREDLRAKHGMKAIAVIVEPKIRALLQAGHNVVLDSIYSYPEYEYIRDTIGITPVMIAIHATKTLRYERLGTRSERPLTPEQVDARDFAETTNLDKARPIAMAHFHYVNDGSLADLEDFISKTLQKI